MHWLSTGLTVYYIHFWLYRVHFTQNSVIRPQSPVCSHLWIECHGMPSRLIWNSQSVTLCLWDLVALSEMQVVTQQSKRQSWMQVHKWSQEAAAPQMLRSISSGSSAMQCSYQPFYRECSTEHWKVPMESPHLHWEPIMMSHWGLINLSELIWREQGTFVCHAPLRAWHGITLVL